MNFQDSISLFEVPELAGKEKNARIDFGVYTDSVIFEIPIWFLEIIGTLECNLVFWLRDGGHPTLPAIGDL